MVTCKNCSKCKEIAKNVFVCEVFDVPAHPNDGICEFGELRIDNEEGGKDNEPKDI